MTLGEKGMRGFGWLIALALAFGLGLGVVVTPIMRADISSGDWLTFSGALLGVGLAVIGALHVERNKLANEAEVSNKRLSQALHKFRELALFEPQRTVPSPGHILAYRFRQLFRMIEVTQEGLEFAVLRADIQDMRQWAVLAVFRKDVREQISIWAPSIAIIENLGVLELEKLNHSMNFHRRSWSIYLDELDELRNVNIR